MYENNWKNEDHDSKGKNSFKMKPEGVIIT